MNVPGGSSFVSDKTTITSDFPAAHDNRSQASCFVLVQSIQDDLLKMIESGERVGAEVDSNHAAAAARERTGIAECLRLLENAEAVRFAGNWKVSVIAGVYLK